MSEETNVQPIGGKGLRTKASLIKAIEGELAEARLKEFRAKLKALVIEREAAAAVLRGKEDQITDLAEQYSDVIPE